MATKYLGNVDFNGENLKVIDLEARGLIQENTNQIASVKAKANLNEQKINALTPRVDTLEDKVDSLDNRLDVAESDIDNLEVHMAAAESDIDNLQDDVNALGNRMTSAEGNIDALTGRMNTAEADIDALQKDVAELTDVVNDHAEKIDGLTDNVESLTDRMTAAETKNTEQDQKLEELDEKIVASTYEAGIGIYFGQGVEHTNINVEDELLDEIHASTRKNIEQDNRLNNIEQNYVEDVSVVNNKITIKNGSGAVENEITGSVNCTPEGTVSQPTFTGNPSTFSASGTPTGTLSGGNVTLTAGTLPSKAADNFVQSTLTYNAAEEELTFTAGTFTEGAFNAGAFPKVDSITQPTFTGDEMTISGTLTPTGTVSQPTFTGTKKTETVDFAD